MLTMTKMIDGVKYYFRQILAKLRLEWNVKYHCDLSSLVLVLDNYYTTNVIIQ